MKDYYIEFSNVKNNGGGDPIVATRVTIGTELISDLDKPLNIALVDDPLYPQLEQYVRANPSGKYIAPSGGKKH